MPTTNIAFHQDSAVSKLYNELKDGKRHKFSTVSAKFKKMGVKKPYALALRLCLALRRNSTGKMISLSKPGDFIQMVRFEAAGKHAVPKVKAKAVKKVAKTKVSAQSKPVAVVMPSGLEEE